MATKNASFSRSTPIASSRTGGTVFSTPVGRQVQPVAPQAAFNQFYGAPQNTTTGPVGGGGGGGGGGNGRMSEGDALSRGLDANFLRSQGLLIDTPQQPQIDFDALIRPALEGLDAAITPLQSGYDTMVSDINSRRGTQIASTNQQIGAQEAQLGQTRTAQVADSENAVNEQRRGLSEIQQGLQARYGGSTGTGGFASEYAGSQALRNIGNIRTTLAQNLQQIDDKLLQVKEIGRIALQDIEDKTREQIGSAKQNLDLQLADIRRQKGELQSKKAELAANAMQLYQQTVNQVNAQNAQFKQQLYVQQLEAEQQLKLALQRGSKAAQSLTLGNFFDPATKQTTPVGVNPKTGQVSRLQGPGGPLTGQFFGMGSQPDQDDSEDLF